MHNYQELKNGALINLALEQLEPKFENWKPYNEFAYLKSEAEIRKFSLSNWEMASSKIETLKDKHSHSLKDLDLTFNTEKLLEGNVGEFNQLILKVMTLYSKLNEDELIVTLCTIDFEFQAIIRRMIESFNCASVQSSEKSSSEQGRLVSGLSSLVQSPET